MTTLPRPRAILLDLDRTIMDHDGASRAGFLAAVAADGATHLDGHEAAWARWRKLEDKHYQRYLDGELSHDEQRIVRTREFLESCGRAETDTAVLQRWYDQYRECYVQSWRAFDDVQPFLDGVHALADAPQIAVVTNGDQTLQAAKLTALGLDGLTMYASSEVGARKPDRAIFTHVCQELHVNPADAWFIGDNHEVDAVGAERAGLHGIWLNRENHTDNHSRPARAATLLDVLNWAKAAQ